MSEGSPLHGVLVVEFGNLIAAPYACMLLADLGARVVKVEPAGGDLGRRFGPFQGDESSFFMAVNRGKESLALDTKDWLSKRVLDNLVKKADVLVHNLRPGAIERLGFGEARARDLNLNLVYGVVSAFGADGPYARRAGVDVVFQGESGMISISGDPRDGPHKTATTIADYVAGTNMALAVSAALAKKRPRGCRIDVSLRDGVMAVQSGWNALALAAGGDPARTGTASPFISPNQVFTASDAPFTLAIVSDRHFELMADALERPDLAKAYPDNASRMEHRDQLARKLARIFKTEPAEYWIELFEQVGLPTGRVLTLTESLADPQARHNEMLVEMEHPTAGPIRVTGSPIRIDGSPARSASPPMPLGQHTRSLLAELGLDASTIDEMIEKGTAIVA